MFRKAENLAKSLGISRSQLYTTALKTFVAEHDEDDVTKRLNEVYSEQDSSLDPVLEKMQFMSLPEEQW